MDLCKNPSTAALVRIQVLLLFNGGDVRMSSLLRPCILVSRPWRRGGFNFHSRRDPDPPGLGGPIVDFCLSPYFVVMPERCNCNRKTCYRPNCASPRRPITPVCLQRSQPVVPGYGEKYCARSKDDKTGDVGERDRECWFFHVFFAVEAGRHDLSCQLRKASFRHNLPVRPFDRMT